MIGPVRSKKWNMMTEEEEAKARATQAKHRRSNSMDAEVV